MKTVLVALLGLASSACVVAGARPVLPGTGPGPAATPPAHGGGNQSNGIDAGRAEAIALKVAKDHGYTEAKAEKVHHDEGQGGRWKVEIRGLANGRDGKLDVRISDGGEILDVKDHQKGPKDDKDKGEKKDKEDKGNGKDK